MARPTTIGRWAVVAMSLALGAPAFAQRPDLRPEPGHDDLAPPPPERPRGQPQQIDDCDEARLLGGTPKERAAACAMRSYRFIDGRTFAAAALEANPDSFRAHYLMGVAQHLGEANLPKALNHLEQAETLFIQKFGRKPDRENSPWIAYQRILRELVSVTGEMDHHEEKIAYVDALYKRLDLDYEPMKAWPLMKLKRFDEARAIAKKGSEKEGHWYQPIALTALCAVESEQKKRFEAYEACRAAAKYALRGGPDGSIELSNAAAAAEEVFRFDEAERMYLESTRRIPEGSVNPWGRLVRLYVRQGRFAEAVSAWRQMREYRARRPGGHLDQQDQAEADLLGVEVMLMAGRATEAERVTRRTVQRPDRQGTSSADSGQNEAGAAIMDRVSKLTSARLLEEDATLSPSWWTAAKLRAEALRLRLDAWAVGRRAAELMSDEERLIATLRPECPGSVEGPAWLDPEVVRLVGPGVTLAALDRARAVEVLPSEQADMIFGVHEAEAYWLAGDERSALRIAKATLERLPRFELMLRARVAAVGADAAERLGEYDDAYNLYQQVVTMDPGVLRRLGLRLPVRLSYTDAPEATRAAQMLSASPRLNMVDWGFELKVSVQDVRLFDRNGNHVAAARVRPGRADSEEAVARRIARSVHRALLVPEVDLTQSDIQSLDGGLGSGGKASERVRGILEEMSEP